MHRKCSKCCRAACHTAVDASVLCPAHSKRERKNIRKMAAAGGIDVACGDGFAETDSSQSARVPYVSKCRVVLVGIGADEQLAGYGRHRTVHKKGTEREVGRGELSLLEQELDKDVTRLWKRNLGRSVILMRCRYMLNS